LRQSPQAVTTKKKGTPLVKVYLLITVQRVFCGSSLENEPPWPFFQTIEPGYYNFITHQLPFHFILLQQVRKLPADSSLQKKEQPNKFYRQRCVTISSYPDQNLPDANFMQRR